MDTRNQLQNKNSRNSSMELLKIIAIIFIVLSHSMPDGDVNTYNSAIDIELGCNIQIIIIQIMHNLGQIGNDIFLVCSCWFLLDDNSVKGEKIARLFGDAFFVSVVSLIIFTLAGYQFPVKYFIEQFIPILSGNSWFLSCYILLYAVHPFLNIVINKLSKRQLCSMSTCLFIMYCCIYFVLRNIGFYYSQIIGFITIYFVTAYLKKYLIKLIKNNSLLLVIVCAICMFAVNLMSNYIVIKTGVGLYSRWNTFNNPLFLIIAFGTLGIALKRNFTNKVVNYISGLSLLIYITHTNRIIRDYVRFDFFQFILENYTYSNLLGWCFVYFVVSLVYGIVFSLIYKFLFEKVMNKISMVVYRFTSVIWNKTMNVISNISE